MRCPHAALFSGPHAALRAQLHSQSTLSTSNRERGHCVVATCGSAPSQQLPAKTPTSALLRASRVSMAVLMRPSFSMSLDTVDSDKCGLWVNRIPCKPLAGMQCSCYGIAAAQARDAVLQQRISAPKAAALCTAKS